MTLLGRPGDDAGIRVAHAERAPAAAEVGA
jgi:hypothetical protein